jgi:UDPglucose 6-dehydrogenase
MRVTVIGLGRLGAPLAAFLADAGHEVVGVDRNPDVVAMLDDRRAAAFEPELDALLESVGDRFAATTDLAAAVAASDMTFVVVSTPSEANGGFSLKYLLPAIEAVGEALRASQRDHVVVVTSTVMPGSVDGPIRAALEAASGRAVGQGLGLCYSPQFIALGSVIRDLRRPAFILVGETEPWGGDRLAAFYRGIHDAPSLARMAAVNAEIAKLAVNSFVTTKISLANTLVDICDRMPGADVDAISKAVGLDPRIGGKGLKGALGYGGPCFPRDNKAFVRLAETLGARADLAAATDAVNDNQVARLQELVLRHLPPGGHVAVLGLTYKPDTAVVEASQGVMLAAALAGQGASVAVHDPMGMDAARAVLGDAVAYAESAAACVAGADVVVLATPWPEYAALDPVVLWDAQAEPLVIDCWRVLPRAAFAPHCRLLGLGQGAFLHTSGRTPGVAGGDASHAQPDARGQRRA